MACDWLCVECLRPVPPAAEPGGADCPGCHGMVGGCGNCKEVLADLRAGSLDNDTPLTPVRRLYIRDRHASTEALYPCHIRDEQQVVTRREVTYTPAEVPEGG